jgi:hypothetical protein
MSAAPGRFKPSSHRSPSPSEHRPAIPKGFAPAVQSTEMIQ